MLYFQNFPELTRSSSLCSRTTLSFWRSRESSLFTPSIELVNTRVYLASLSSGVTLLKNKGSQYSKDGKRQNYCTYVMTAVDKDTERTVDHSECLQFLSTKYLAEPVEYKLCSNALTALEITLSASNPLLLTVRISSLQKLSASGCLVGEKAAWKAWQAAEAAGV